jgi:hypothetical protein
MINGKIINRMVGEARHQVVEDRTDPGGGGRAPRVPRGARGTGVVATAPVARPMTTGGNAPAMRAGLLKKPTVAAPKRKPLIKPMAPLSPAGRSIRKLGRY